MITRNLNGKVDESVRRTIVELSAQVDSLRAELVSVKASSNGNAQLSPIQLQQVAGLIAWRSQAVFGIDVQDPQLPGQIGGGTITRLDQGIGIVFTPNPINGVGAIALDVPVSIAHGGTGDTGTAWAIYTPAVSAGAGAFTAVAANGYWKSIGKMVFIHVAITITTNGTAATDMRFTLPVATANNDDQVLTGMVVNNNKSTATYLRKNSTTITPTTYSDGTYPGADGNVLLVAGAYESA